MNRHRTFAMPVTICCAVTITATVCATSAVSVRTAGQPESPRPALALLGDASSAGDPTAGAAENDRPRHGWAHFVRWIGHFHPPLTAFPIAMLAGAALAELLRLVSGAAWLDGASRWCVILGAVSGAVTAPLGWAFALDHAGSWVLEVHRWLGTAAGAGALVILVLSEMSRRPNRTSWVVPFRVVLFLAVPLVLATGFFGGAMVYGLHAYHWNSPESRGGESQ